WQPGDQLQAPAHPARITPAALRELVLGEPQTLDELAQDERFFNRRQRACLRAAEHGDERLRELTAPALDESGVAPQPLERGRAPITIEQHHLFTVGHPEARHELPVSVDRAR